jgi:hypothetical protein
MDQAWTPDLENNVKRIGEKSTGYKIMHNKSAQRAATLYNRIMYLGIALGPLAGLLSGVGSALDPDAPIVFPLISSFVAFLSGIVVALVKFGKWDEITTAHKSAAAKYTSLESNVRRQLALSRPGRSEPYSYVRWVGTSFDDLFLASPIIQRNIYAAYAKTAIKAKLTVPDEYGLMVPIDPIYVLQQKDRLTSTNAIHVNDNKKPEKVPLEVKHLDTKAEKTQHVRKTSIFTSIPDLNHFSAGKMEYEMRRFRQN